MKTYSVLIRKNNVEPGYASFRVTGANEYDEEYDRKLLRALRRAGARCNSFRGEYYGWNMKPGLSISGTFEVEEVK